MHSVRPRRSPLAGFSLIEISVVMAILSVVAVMGLQGVATFMGRTAYKTTSERLDVIQTALMKYRKVYGYLPCPANPSDTLASPSYGKETRSSGTCTQPELVTGVRFGDVPVRDLNLPLSYIKDGYGQKFRYIVTTGLTTATGFVANSAAIKIRTGKLQQPCSTVCQELTTRAAFVIFSHGSDMRGAGSKRCINGTLDDNSIDSANCRLLSGQSVAAGSIPLDTFYDSRFNSGSVEDMHFDDILVWKGKGQL